MKRNMERSITTRVKGDPVLLDRALQNIQIHLEGELPWLDRAFGRAYRMVEHRPDGGKFIYPAAYNGNGEYVSMLPNDNIGNFSWFDIYDPQRVVSRVHGFPQYISKGALVFWYDLTTIYSDPLFIYTEEVKAEVLRALTAPGLLQSRGRLEVEEIYERFDNIYKGYSIEKAYNDYAYSDKDVQSMDKQFFMHPYAGLRIEFNLIMKETCS